jgi:hypothetical protein
MAIEIKDWTKQIEDLSILGLEQLHEVYSEMLATAHDIGYVVPDEQLVETDDDTKLREVIEVLHPEIVKFAAENSREPTEKTADKGAKKTAASKEKKVQKKPATGAAKKAAPVSPKKPAKPAAQKGDNDVDHVDQKESTNMASAKKTTKAPAKKAKKAPAKKAAKKASDNARTPVGRSKFKPEATINVKLKENPTKAGTGRFDRVANLMKHNGKTVEQFLKSGGKTGTLSYSVAQGWITIK